MNIGCIFMIMEWYKIDLLQTAGIAVTTLIIFFGIIIAIKINGIRSLAKLSSHDFIVTIAIGSILGATVTQKDPSLLQGFLAIALLLAFQSAFSLWRIYRKKNALENEPILLMSGSEILYSNLKATRITENDLLAKLREANVLNIKDVKAVVFEQTGDISVLHGDKEIDSKLLENVRTKP